MNKKIIELLKNFKNREEYEEAENWLFDLDFEIEGGDSLESLAYQLTAYESCGCIDFDKFIINQIESYFGCMSEHELADLNNENGGDWIYDDLEEMVQYLKPLDIVYMIHCGDFHGETYGYYKSDAYGNIKEDYPSNMIDFEELSKKLYEDIKPDEDVKKFICEMALELVKNGF